MKYSHIILATLMLFASCRKDLTFQTGSGTVINQELLNAAGIDLAGYKIAFTDLSNIYMMNPDGTNVEKLTETGRISGYVSWSEDAKYIYFAGVHTNSPKAAWEAYRVNVKTKELTQITKFDLDVRSLGVSPDGNTFAVSVMTGNSNIGNNNNNLTQFSTNLYTASMSDLESKLATGNYLEMSDLTPLQSAENSEQFWFEELSWNHDTDNPTLAYTKTWRYDEDDVSYTHTYTVKSDGSDNTLIAENQDQPVWNFEHDKLSFLGLEYYDFNDATIKQVNVTGINDETSGGGFSPLGGAYMVIEIGDLNRKGGIVKTTGASDAAQYPHIGIYEPRWSPVIVE